MSSLLYLGRFRIRKQVQASGYHLSGFSFPASLIVNTNLSIPWLGMWLVPVRKAEETIEIKQGRASKYLSENGVKKTHVEEEMWVGLLPVAEPCAQSTHLQTGNSYASGSFRQS